MGDVHYCYSCGHLKLIEAKCPNCMTLYPRTQKGKGLIVLRSIVGNPISAAFVTDPEALPETGWPKFCRPAPSEPKHGYIDSRLVKSKPEAAKLLKKVLADDPQGELILCPYVKAKWNAVLTPISLTVGAGNAGATSGTNAATIPLVEFQPTQPGHLKSAGIGEDSWPYFELVQSVNQFPIFVQMRGGPKLPRAFGNIIPHKFEVKQVLKADPAKYKDRGWELAVAKAKDIPGLVVWHPGGSVADHFSIHSFANGLPLVFDAQSPVVGQVLEPGEVKPPEFDPQAMLRGFIAGDLLPMKTLGENGVFGNSVVTAMLIGLHNAAVMTESASQWIGFSAAIMLRLGSIAMRGEARHVGSTKNKVKPARQSVYAKYRAKSVSYHRASLNRLINVFRYGQWPSSGFGGHKWACCGATLVGLFNSIQQLAEKQDQASANKVVAELNLAVNQAHNGGWWLNKFAEQALFDQVPKGDIQRLVYAIDVYGTGNKILKQLEKQPGVVAKKIARYKAWPVTRLAPPYTKAASISFHPVVGTIKMLLTTRLLQGNTRAISAKVTGTLTPEQIEAMKTKTYLVEGEDGYQLEVKNGTELPLVIWKEDSLAAAAVNNSVKKGE